MSVKYLKMFSESILCILSIFKVPSTVPNFRYLYSRQRIYQDANIVMFLLNTFSNVFKSCVRFSCYIFLRNWTVSLFLWYFSLLFSSSTGCANGIYCTNSIYYSTNSISLNTLVVLLPWCNHTKKILLLFNICPMLYLFSCLTTLDSLKQCYIVEMKDSVRSLFQISAAMSLKQCMYYITVQSLHL